MRYGVVFAFLALILSACSTQSTKIKNITFFTPIITPDVDASAVQLSNMQKATSWEEGVNWVNNEPKHFEIAKLSNKFKSYTMHKGKSIAAPILADGKLFILSDKGYLTAYDEANNKVFWSVNLKHSEASIYYQGALSYSEGKIYVTSATRDLISIDSSSGMILWRYKLPDISKSQPVIYKNIILVTTVSNELCAIDKNTGGVLWQNDGVLETLSLSRDIAPIIHDNKVIVGYSSGQLVCLDVLSGRILWEINLSGDESLIPGFIPISLESQPIVENSSIYLAGAKGKMLKVNLNNGSIEWKKDVADIHSMSKSGNSIFVTTNAMQVAAINDKTGAIVWVNNLFDHVEKTNNFLRKKAKSNVVLLPPVVINDNLFIISAGGEVYKLSPYDGTISEIINIDKDARYVMITDSFNIFTKTHRLVIK